MTKIIDVSEYQPNIDYAKVKATGIGGAILRCGYTGWGSSHSLNADKSFEQHYAGFQAAGVQVGAYYYSTADTVEFAKKEAEYVQSLLKGKRFELPIYYDLRTTSGRASCQRRCLPRLRMRFVLLWRTRVILSACTQIRAGLRASSIMRRLSAKYTIWLADYRGKQCGQNAQARYLAVHEQGEA